jgi:1,2-diacylglycerol-3-alpha-glucose alpha-1,2-glucosyltransferase
MKICHYSDLDLSGIDIIGGGAETSIEHQKKAFVKAGIEYTTDPSEDYDILHLNLLGLPSLYHMLKAKRKGKKVVIHVHWTAENFRNSFRGSNLAAPLVDWYTKLFYRRADLLVAVSEYTKRVVESKNLDTEIRVLSNGVDGENLEGYRELEGKENSFWSERSSAVNLAAVFERKGISDYLAAAEEIEEMEFDWFGPKNKLLTPRKTKKKMKNSPENLEFHGFIEDKREGLASGDIFFFPSRSEEEGISILEAAYCRLPLVVRDIPAYDGWLVHGENCLKGEDTEELVKNLKRLKEDKKLREELGEKAREMAEERTLDKIGEGLKKIYREVEG